MTHTPQTIRVAIYGCGRWANRTRIPNLVQIDGVELVLCDVDPGALASTAAAFGVTTTYQDAHHMLEAEPLDALYSLVRAHVRTDVEIAAAERGIHLFSEKPQALNLPLACRIDDAVRRGGVLSTVGFRERYRPLFQEARRLLAGKAIVHVCFQSVRPLPDPTYPPLAQSGGPGVNWGVHAVDCVRYMTGLDVVRAQAFYCQRPAHPLPLSQSAHYVLSGGATMTVTFVLVTDRPAPGQPWFTVFYEGGTLAIYGYDRIDVDGETVTRGEAFDPWLAQDRAFTSAVRAGDGSLLLSDYHDGLHTLAPVLAAWDSAQNNGELVDVPAFLDRARAEPTDQPSPQ